MRAQLRSGPVIGHLPYERKLMILVTDINAYACTHTTHTHEEDRDPLAPLQTRQPHTHNQTVETRMHACLSHTSGDRGRGKAYTISPTYAPDMHNMHTYTDKHTGRERPACTHADILSNPQ